MDAERLARLDSRGYVVLEALSYAGKSGQGVMDSHKFVFIDGKTYWVKRTAQQGLVSELIVGRLAGKVGAGPRSVIVRVTDEALDSDRKAAHLVGIGVGSEDQPGTVNAKVEIQPFIDDRTFAPASLDCNSRANVIVFQTWLGLGDTQVLVNLRNGRVQSIDHGECFSATTLPSRPVPQATPIPGVPDDCGKDEDSILAAVERVEQITDSDLLAAVAQVPVGPDWRSESTRRVEIARWLADRRDQMKEVMLEWLQSS